MLDLFASLARHVATLTPEAFDALMRSRPDVAGELFPDVPDGQAVEVDVQELTWVLSDAQGVGEALLSLTRAEVQVLMAMTFAADEVSAAQARASGHRGGAGRFIQLLSVYQEPLEADPVRVRETLCAALPRAARAEAAAAFDQALARLTDMCLVWPKPGTGLWRVHDVAPEFLPDPGPEWDRFEPVPPFLDVARRRPVAEVDGQAQAAAVAALEHSDRLLRHIAAEPVSLLKAGGVGTREIRRLVRVCGMDEPAVRFWLHILENAGLVALGEGGKLEVGPDYEDWGSAEPGQRYTTLFASWIGLKTSVLGPFTPAARGGPAPTLLADTSFDGIGQHVRLAVLELMTACGAGVAADVEALAAALLWRMPLVMETYFDDGECLCGECGAVPGDTADTAGTRSTGARTAAAAVATVLAEGETLGAVSLGAVASVVRTTFGPATLNGPAFEADLAAALARTLPATTPRVRIQGDMTVVAAGLPAPGLAAFFDASAERQPGGGAATVWRITDGSVRRWLDSGRSAAELLAGLAEYCDDALPQPLTYLVQDAGRRHGLVDVVAARAVVVAADAALGAELAVLPALVRLGARPVADRVLVLDAPPEEVLAALRFAGHLPAAHHADGSPIVAVGVQGRRL